MNGMDVQQVSNTVETLVHTLEQEMQRAEKKGKGRQSNNREAQLVSDALNTTDTIRIHFINFLLGNHPKVAAHAYHVREKALSRAVDKAVAEHLFDHAWVTLETYGEHLVKNASRTLNSISQEHARLDTLVMQIGAQSDFSQRAALVHDKSVEEAVYLSNFIAHIGMHDELNKLARTVLTQCWIDKWKGIARDAVTSNDDLLLIAQRHNEQFKRAVVDYFESDRADDLNVYYGIANTSEVQSVLAQEIVQFEALGNPGNVSPITGSTVGAYRGKNSTSATGKHSI